MKVKSLVYGLGVLLLISQCGTMSNQAQQSFQEHEVRASLDQSRDRLKDQGRKAEQDSRAWLEVIETQGCVPVVDAKTGEEAPFLVGEKVFISPDDVRPLPADTVICNSTGAVGVLGNFDGEIMIARRGQIVAKHMEGYLLVFNAIASRNFGELQ